MIGSLGGGGVATIGQILDIFEYNNMIAAGGSDMGVGNQERPQDRA